MEAEGESPDPPETKGLKHMSDEKNEGKLDQAKGNLKQAAGGLTGDDELKNEGRADEAGGNVKEKAGDVADKAGDAVDKVTDKAKDAVNRD